MTGPMLHVGAGISCTHGAPAQVAPGSPRVLLSGQPAAAMADVWTIVGCPFQIPIGTGTKPSPCVRVQWTVPATRVMINGSPALTVSSVGMGMSPEGLPQGPPIPTVVQPRVVAT